MSDARARRGPWPGFGIAAVQLFGACGFAVAQPLFDVLARHAPFLVAHGARPGEVVALAALALLAPTLGALAPVAVARALGERAAAAALALAIGALAAATALPPLHRAPALAFLGATGAAGVAAALGAGAAALYRRSALARRFATLLGAAPLVFATLFLLAGPVARLVVDTAGDARAAASHVRSDAPIVVVVLDEFGLSALLDREGHIDAVRYPAFAALARTSTWYRGARAVHTSTLHAVPSIATGRFPDPALLPRAADHPENLFALFAASHAMHVVESQTMLFEPEAGARASREPGAFRALAADAALVYLHVLLPPAWAARLPSIGETWGRFRETTDRDRQLAVFGRKAVFEGFVDRKARVDAFVEGLGACGRACLHFLHVLLPHRPWEYLPSERRIVPWDSPGLGKQERFGDDAWLVDQAEQQYLLQVGAVDAMLARVRARLEALGTWDDAAVVVLADHGVSFRPGASMRWLDDGAAIEDVVRIPMFVKAPGQRAGAVVDEPVLTVDVLPTLARAVGVAVPWRVDGCAIASDAEARACERADATGARRRVVDRDDRAHEVPDDLATRGEGLQHRLALFGAGDDDAYAFGPHRELVGVRVAERAGDAPARFAARFDRAAVEALARDPDGVSLARITVFLRHADGSPAAADERVPLAFAVDGVVRAVGWARAHAAGSLVARAIVPEAALAPGSHRLSVHVVASEDGRSQPVLEAAGETEVVVP
ncbi:MAG: sulfatase-like hydrolase/transferase [Myxococcota bacterium]